MEGDLTDAVIRLCQTGWAKQLVEEGIEAALRKRAELGPTRDEVALRFCAGLAANSGLEWTADQMLQSAFDFADLFCAYSKGNPPK